MSQKAKSGHGRPRPRVLEQLTILMLVLVALLVGASHSSLQAWVRDSLSIHVLVEEKAQHTRTDASFAVATLSIDNGSIESIIYGQLGLDVLTVTVAENIRIEYILYRSEESRVLQEHHSTMLTLICAIRKVSPTRRPIIFAGVARLIDRSGKMVYRSRVETKLSTLKFNLINCASLETSADVDWTSIADYHRTFVIPETLRVSG